MATALPAPQLMRHAVQLHAAGRLEEAEQVYQRVLRARSNDFDALHMLGVVRTQQGRHREAVRLISDALRVQPAAAAAHVNLANSLQALGRHDEAIRHLRAAIALKADLVDAHSNLGSVLIASGRHEEAETVLKRALALNPRHPQTLNNLGNALGKQHRFEEAADCYRRAVALAPDYAEAHYNLGTARAALGDGEDAMASYRAALAARPDLSAAANNLASELMRRFRHAEALPYLQSAVASAPHNAEALNNLGLVLAHLRRFAEAADAYRRALASKPDFVPVLKNMAVTLQRLDRLDDAAACLARAVELEPDDGALRAMKVGLARRMCRWERLAEDQQATIDRVDTSPAPVPPFTLMTFIDDPALHLRAARRHAAMNGFDRPAALAPRVRYRHDRIRLAYLSSDLHEHATAYLLAEIFELHDRSRFEVSAYSWGIDDGSPMRRRLRRAFDNFHDVGAMSDRDVARQIREREVDIVIDLKGYTEGCRPEILAERPAPIQVNYLGYPGSLGAAFIDYAIVDSIVVPPSSRETFSEELVFLPDCYQPNDRQRPLASAAPSRADCGLPAAGFVFASFNNNHKISPDLFDVWMRLLQAVPGSVLWLLQDNRWAGDNLRKEAQARGVSPDRLVFATRTTLDRHLARQPLADLFLDTLPYNAHTTASDALWMGVPVLTCAGSSFAARVAASLLLAANLPDLVTQNLAEYEALAKRLAADPVRLSAIRKRVADSRNTSALFDSARYCRNLEAAYSAMVQRLPP